MKLRKGFVTNSSSTCFLVLGKNTSLDPIKHIQDWESIRDCVYGTTLDLTEVGSKYTEFGWGFIKYDDFLSKLCFALIYSFYTSEDLEPYEVPNESKKNLFNYMCIKLPEEKVEKLNNFYLLQNLLAHQFGIKIDTFKIDGYIDHQSYECGLNVDIFRDANTLKDFLLSEKSYIKTGNDNEDGPDDWYSEVGGE